MAEAARPHGSLAGLPPPEPREPDPRAAGWADVRALLLIRAGEAAALMAELTRRPRDAAALHRADLMIKGLGCLAGLLRRCVVDEAILAAVREEAYGQGYADGKAAARCGLQLVSGGR